MLAVTKQVLIRHFSAKLRKRLVRRSPDSSNYSSLNLSRCLDVLPYLRKMAPQRQGPTRSLTRHTRRRRLETPCSIIGRRDVRLVLDQNRGEPQAHVLALVATTDGRWSPSCRPRFSGPPRLTTSSEVATLDFLRRLGLPVPQVLAWNLNPKMQPHDIGAEYILMDKPHGISLRDMERDGRIRVDPHMLVKAVSDAILPLAKLEYGDPLLDSPRTGESKPRQFTTYT
ncbi:hypothetical protein BXZ70DRAFT_446059 [Cristinia sonorae]|uniref:Uncharacterized protein n=1 Tax=Cristinia sonorae TaxID=1940300 RepID=A0A8K0XM39_9AGAR|nr:hypothetical protein BXZ70DRAFT_446059 [Cristinia sonorae]